ncbi:MAG: hypothetical protein M1836_004999 [Candelina mexicana]|nr:MAG: hypothetical protein M1836_004999 [Candelina mexicana]
MLRSKKRFREKKDKGKLPADISPEEGQNGQPLLIATFEPAVNDSQHCIFPFQKLPPELRNRIYRYVFVSDENIGARDLDRKAFLRAAQSFLNLNFLLSCRQIHQEAAHIFYAENGFEFVNANTILQFLQRMGKHNRKLLTKLRYNHGAIVETLTPLIKLILDCSNLKELDIRMIVWDRTYHPRSWHATPVLNALDVLRGSRKAELGELGFVIGGADTKFPEAEMALCELLYLDPFHFPRSHCKMLLEEFIANIPAPSRSVNP